MHLDFRAGRFQEKSRVSLQYLDRMGNVLADLQSVGRAAILGAAGRWGLLKHRPACIIPPIDGVDYRMEYTPSLLRSLFTTLQSSERSE